VTRRVQLTYITLRRGGGIDSGVAAKGICGGCGLRPRAACLCADLAAPRLFATQGKRVECGRGGSRGGGVAVRSPAQSCDTPSAAVVCNWGRPNRTRFCSGLVGRKDTEQRRFCYCTCMFGEHEPDAQSSRENHEIFSLDSRST